MTRRDKRGRRIGYNWWREYNVNLHRDAYDAWERRRESGAPAYNAAGAANSDVACYQLEDDEYRRLYPTPTFKAALIANAGMHLDPAEG